MAQNVVITGASAGVGRAAAARFAADGARIGLVARGRARLDAAAAEVEKLGGRAVVCPADVADAEAVEEAADAAERAFGPIDVWINCAMATVFGPFTDISPEEFRRATEVTYLGAVHGTMAALRRMKPRDVGVIVQIGSALAYRSVPLQAPYCGAKHAIIGFTDSLRSELIHDGSLVRLVVVNLPSVNTPQFDWGRNKMPRAAQPVPPIFQPEEAASAIHYAARQSRRELWLGWPTMKAIVGQRLVPALADRLLASQGYSGQQTDEPARDRPDNLFSPVDGEFGAHGRFDDRARKAGSEFWLEKRRPMIALGRAFDWAFRRTRGQPRRPSSSPSSSPEGGEPPRRLS